MLFLETVWTEFFTKDNGTKQGIETSIPFLHNGCDAISKWTLLKWCENSHYIKQQRTDSSGTRQKRHASWSNTSLTCLALVDPSVPQSLTGLAHLLKSTLPASVHIPEIPLFELIATFITSNISVRLSSLQCTFSEIFPFWVFTTDILELFVIYYNIAFRQCKPQWRQQL